MMRMLILGAAFIVALGLGSAVARADTLAPAVKQAEAMLDANKNSEALTLLNGYLAQHPKDARALVDRGDAYEALNRHQEAIVEYTAALAVNPEYAYAYASRCQSHEELDQHKQALQDCDRAIELDPKSGYALRQRAIVDLAMGDVAGANVDADKAVDVAGNSAASHGIRCRARFFAQKYDEAATDCADALQIDPKSYQARFYSGRLAIHSKDWKTAESFFSSLLVDDATDDGAAYWRAISREHLQENEGALSDINFYIKNNPDDGDGYMVRARVQYQLHDLAAAKEDGTTALRRYQIDNDTDSITEAQQFLSDLAAGKDPNAG